MFRNMLRVLYGIYALAAFAVVILLVFCPLLIAAPFLSWRRAIGRVTVRAWLMSVGVKFKVTGLQHLPTGPCVVVCNHASYVDGIVLTAALPVRFTFLVQHGTASWPYVGLIVRRMGVRFVNRTLPRAAARATLGLVRELRAGGSVAIFPEGTFRVKPGLQPFYTGAFFLAAKTDVPVVPVAMRGTRRFFSDGARWPSWSSIDIEMLPARYATAATRESIDVLKAEIFEDINRCCGETDDDPIAIELQTSMATTC